MCFLKRDAGNEFFLKREVVWRRSEKESICEKKAGVCLVCMFFGMI